jgi:phage baseplate assembly protein W
MSNGNSIARLGTPACLAFPFRIGAAGPTVSRGADHVREQIEQVLFTTPGERVFRSEFGAGVKTLTFEPNNQPLWEVARRRILAALTIALRGDIQPNRLDVSADGTGEQLQIVVSYQLASVGVTQRQRFFVGIIDRG